MKRLWKSRWFLLAALLLAGSLVLLAICWFNRDRDVYPATAADLNDLIAERGSITFRSWDGKWIGTDCDTDITFLPDGVACLVNYFYSDMGYKGTYTINANGQITLQFQPTAPKWPVLVLKRDATSLLLRRRGWREGFFMETRTHERPLHSIAGYWPFRPVPADQEGIIRKELNRWLAGS